MIRSDNLRSTFTQEDVDKYIYDLLPERDAVVKEMEAYAAEHRVPIIGPAVARLLALLVQVSGATRIFEMGSAIGYSTIWLARAAGTKAKVFYTDGNPENARRAQEHFRKAGVAKRINVQVGDALELVKKTPGKFDFIFNDINKHQYPDALRAALPKLQRGGLFVTDNTLWSGKAAQPAGAEDKDTRGVQEFNRLVYASKELFPVLIPLRDGVTVCRKL
jgi:predicted O-methyltransferase YrrM